MGSFWAARCMASRASASSTPLISNITRPGLTTATYASGLPLPLPILVSAGFLVTGLWGKMLIQTFPPRRIFLVIAIRAASIWRLVIQAGSRACSPYSPNCTSVPPLAWPRILPLWGFLYLSFLGTSIIYRLIASGCSSCTPWLIQTLTPICPIWDGLGPALLDAAEPPAQLVPGPFGAAADSARECALHGPPERGAPDELFGDGLGHEARVELGTGDLAYVDLHLLAGEPLEVAPQGVHLAASLADYDPWPRRVYVNSDLTLLGGLPYLDVRYTGPV